jgi:hypothetical protein
LAKEVCYQRKLLVISERTSLELLDEAYSHHRLSFAWAPVNPKKGHVFVVLPSRILGVLNDPLGQSVEQLVFLFQAILDDQRIWALQSIEACPSGLVGVVRCVFDQFWSEVGNSSMYLPEW